MNEERLLVYLLSITEVFYSACMGWMLVAKNMNFFQMF